MERSLKMLGIYGICISFASRQIVHLLGANGVHIMPGTSKNKTPKLLFKSVSEFFVIGNCLPIL